MNQQVAQQAQNSIQDHIAAWQQQNPALVQRGIDESTWGALNSTIYPGAKPNSILLAVDYCRARGLDIMLKPVHLVPMSVKNAQTGNYEWRDVPMPGIGLYRIQAERSKTYAGADAAKFGPEITKNLGGVEVTFPEWCEYTVYKLMGDRIVKYSALEYWEENYATKGKDSEAPNSMWAKRPRGQLAKCAEAQALRKAWPEIGQEPTAEEMEGKSFVFEKDVTPRSQPAQIQTGAQQALQTAITEKQKQQLIDAATVAGVDETYICQKARVSNIEELQQSRFEAALNHLKGLAMGGASNE